MAPLDGIRVVELGGIGPGPFCGMLLADMGAEVIRVDRPEAAGGDPHLVLGRGKRSVVLDLKRHEDVEAMLAIVASADVFIDVLRPGVCERLGIGPDECLARHPGLVYARMTGWGQSGPQAARAGHDIDYIAVTGALHAIGVSETPVVPLNLIGDYGGGALYLAMGILAALIERQRTGRGQVIDVAMVDGAASLTAPIQELAASGGWVDERAANLLDGGAPFYSVYRTLDDRFMAVGSLEPKFFAELLEGLGLVPSEVPAQYDRAEWPTLRRILAETFASRTRDAWEQQFEHTDACVAPVLSLREAHEHRYNAERDVFIEVNGVIQPAPAPRFGDQRLPGPSPRIGRDTAEVLREVEQARVRRD